MTTNESGKHIFYPQEPALPSKDNMVLIFFQTLVKRYIEATAPYWKKIPEYYNSNQYIVINRRQRVSSSLISLLKRAAVVFKKPAKMPDLPVCDALFCYSTPKSIWQFTMHTLGERLAQKGYRIAIINSRMMEIIEYDRDHQVMLHSPVEGFVDYREKSNHRLRSISNLFRSLGHVIFLFSILKQDRDLRKELFQNPFVIWLEYFTRLQYFDISEQFIRQLKPRLIVSNHIILPFSSEIMATSASKSAYRIWFCNENPAGIHIAPDICNEIWFWNQIHLEAHRLLVMPGAEINMEISGHAETDIVMAAKNEQFVVTEEEAELIEKTRGRKVLLYLSTYYPPTYGMDVDSIALAHELADWMERVSISHPDWWFIYKDRPTRFGEKAPGFDRLEELPNCIFPKNEINFLNFLKWDNLVAVAADASLGLVAAAGMEKLPIWLSTPSQEEHFLPNIEQIALHVNKSNDFCEILDDFDEIYPVYKKWLKERREEIFPNRGAVIDRMEELCLRHLPER